MRTEFGEISLKSVFVAHYCESDGRVQAIEEHLLETSKLTALFSLKLNLEKCGKVLGLLHDLGKYSRLFQRYIKSSVGLLKPEDEDYINPEPLKGRIDHSSPGAQYFYFSNEGDLSLLGVLVREMISLCVCSHHGGFIDCLSVDGEDIFAKRINKVIDYAQYREMFGVSDSSVRQSLQSMDLNELKGEISRFLKRMEVHVRSKRLRVFWIVLLSRYLFSCLVDADRTNTANFEKKENSDLRLSGSYVSWRHLIGDFESHISGFKVDSDINIKRAAISLACKSASKNVTGLYYLTVPTGGGKTLASMRFALHHAEEHGMDRIIYVIPYTSIIDQNADEIRDVFKDSVPDIDKVVLEHHSNITEMRDTKRNRLLSENWDAPIVFTTSVQFLEALFGSGTRGVRRMHALMNSVIIFDEVQTIPVNAVHLFNNAVNFLTLVGNSTCVFCTATQPLLHGVDEKRGAVRYVPEMELVRDASLFEDFRRVTVVDERRSGGWLVDDLCDDIRDKVMRFGSVMVVVNTKKDAERIYSVVKESGCADGTYFLSTKMCSAHRRMKLAEIKSRLNPNTPESIVCVSTQLIEAGVNVDFGCVYRCMAGIDSISQAAGRCNRNNKRDEGLVVVFNLFGEKLGHLPAILEAQRSAERVLNDFRGDPGFYGGSIISQKAITQYYQHYFFERAEEMAYNLKKEIFGRDDNLLSVLSDNSKSVSAAKRRDVALSNRFFFQSFGSAGKCFEVIDAPTQSIFVKYGDKSNELIYELQQEGLDYAREKELLRRLQPYVVNVFSWEMDKLRAAKDALIPMNEERGIFVLQKHYYNDETGLSLEPVSKMESQIA